MHQHTRRAQKANVVMVLKYLLYHQYGEWHPRLPASLSTCLCAGLSAFDLTTTH